VIASFNVTLIHPARYIHALGLADIVTYLDEMLRACGHSSRQTVNHIDRSVHNIVVGGHLLDPANAAQLPADTIVFNSEPLDEPRPGYDEMLARHHVWDYSAVNVSAVPHPRVAVISFGACPALARVTPRTSETLLFYGSITPRRRLLLDAIRASGVRLEAVFGEYGPERDVRLARAKAVLNLHKGDDPRWFQPIRCFYPLINGVPVISEQTTDPGADAFRAAMHFVPTTELVSTLPALLAAPSELHARASSFASVVQTDAVATAVDRYLTSWMDRGRTETSLR